MSVFDPNKDYTKSSDPESLYETVMEVQKVLQEITTLLQAQELDNQQYQSNTQQEPSQYDVRSNESPEIFSDEDHDYTIYDDIFE